MAAVTAATNAAELSILELERERSSNVEKNPLDALLPRLPVYPMPTTAATPPLVPAAAAIPGPEGILNRGRGALAPEAPPVVRPFLEEQRRTPPPPLRLAID